MVMAKRRICRQKDRKFRCVNLYIVTKLQFCASRIVRKPPKAHARRARGHTRRTSMYN